jgi:50S ribosomal protein L16 3-hydroxylase
MSILEALIAPLSVRDFFEKHWPEQPYLAHGSLDRIPVLAPLGDRPVADFIATYPGDARCYVWDLAKWGHAEIGLRPAESKKAFEEGAALILTNAQRHLPMIEPWHHAFAEELGLHATMGYTSTLFASSTGKGAHKHCDGHTTFVIQLRGRKRWWLAPNNNFSNPTALYIPSGVYPLHPELELAKQGELSVDMPEDTQQFDLVPGSVLFLPWGWWHRTEAIEESSMSLSVNFKVPSRVELLTAELRRRLLVDPEWRRIAGQYRGDENARREMTELVDRLVAHVPLTPRSARG